MQVIQSLLQVMVYRVNTYSYYVYGVASVPYISLLSVIVDHKLFGLLPFGFPLIRVKADWSHTGKWLVLHRIKLLPVRRI